MADNYRTWVFRISPRWLRDFYGRRFMGGAIGLQFDLLAEGAAQGLKASFLKSTSFPADALPFIGSERRMPRYLADTDDTYNDRLHGAWDAWLHAGNETAIEGQLLAFGLTNVVILPAENHDPRVSRPSVRFEEPPKGETAALIAVDFLNSPPRIIRTDGGSFLAAGFKPDQELQITDTGSGNNIIDGGLIVNTVSASTITIVGTTPFTVESTTATIRAVNWSRFLLVIEEPNPYTPVPLYGDAGLVYGGGQMAGTYGSGATAGDIETIKAIARKWKAGHEINPKIVIVLDGNYYGDPEIAYGDVGLVYGGTTLILDHQI